MTTNSAVRILSAAVLIAAVITAVRLNAGRQVAPAAGLSYRCFAEGTGWGYDVLAGEKVLIHQPIDPEGAGRTGFASRTAAAAHARIVIDKIKLGETPVFSPTGKQRTASLPAQ